MPIDWCGGLPFWDSFCMVLVPCVGSKPQAGYPDNRIAFMQDLAPGSSELGNLVYLQHTRKLMAHQTILNGSKFRYTGWWMQKKYEFWTIKKQTGFELQETARLKTCLQGGCVTWYGPCTNGSWWGHHPNQYNQWKWVGCLRTTLAFIQFRQIGFYTECKEGHDTFGVYMFLHFM